ncbi:MULTISPECIES: hypothetical protein [unclassified Leifsonia]|uniref:hypothetical protein n=1 Tax=unclassified Leifsonia TaxID=2663824 RepID=UPI0006F5DC79|nr:MULTISPECIES: hypothetical protein [unclassified Leifsonia]KQX06656.1 hypothetical protein ASC59_02035 [Leifsonia sp. Root1293]KRA10940.1 hypothetical protein ASD61_02035 [Leifsonia sp. Root60]
MAESVELSFIVSADFSQFYIRTGEAANNELDGFDTSIAYYFDPDALLLTAARQWGELPVTVRIHELRPEPLGPFWRDVAETSLNVAGYATLTGWDPSLGVWELPLLDGISYRVRYAISDIDSAVKSETVTESYLLEIWPEDTAEPKVITQQSALGRYLRISCGLDVLRYEIYRRGDDATEKDRIDELCDRAFAAFPDLWANIINDTLGARRKLSSAAYMLHRNSPLVVRSAEESLEMSAKTRARIDDLILRRAAEYTPLSL